MGSVFGFGPIDQCLSEGCWWKGECLEGTRERGYVSMIEKSIAGLLIHFERHLEGELADLIEDFSDGRIQFAFVKVKDPNSGLPKNVLIAWVSSPF